MDELILCNDNDKSARLNESNLLFFCCLVIYNWDKCTVEMPWTSGFRQFSEESLHSGCYRGC